ncbi:MAG: prepilin-type N-terminal cleavage/methylation domain-containing protein [Bacilli bacterium]|nr:prepilin-type N-terminal cleavage/methylation domain-containing protein [Bacilli bacterium]
MNKKGFTLIEILSVIIIIGIITSIGVFSVTTSIQKTKKSSFSAMAITFLESARSMRGSDKLLYEPKNGEAVVLRLDSLNGTDKIDDYETEFGDLDLDLCYVAIVNDNYQFKYYITMIDNSDHAIINEKYESVKEDSVIAGYNTRNAFNFRTVGSTTTLQIGNTTYKTKTIKDSYVVFEVN